MIIYEDNRLYYNRASLKIEINCLLNNCFLNLGIMCFGQLNRIIMGHNPDHFVANLSLLY